MITNADGYTLVTCPKFGDHFNQTSGNYFQLHSDSKPLSAG